MGLISFLWFSVRPVRGGLDSRRGVLGGGTPFSFYCLGILWDAYGQQATDDIGQRIIMRRERFSE